MTVIRAHPRAIHFFSSIMLSSSEAEVARRFWDRVDSTERIVIMSHISPDGDAIGSMLGLYHALVSIGKSPHIVCHDPAPAHFAFLSGSDLIISTRQYLKDHEAPDLAIVLDCSHPARLGSSMEIVEAAEHVAIVDHHADRAFLEGIQLIDERSSSTGELLFRLLKHGNITITSEAALALYVAIVTDTGSFRYGNTSSVSFNVVAELMQAGTIDVQSVGYSLFARDTLNRMKLRGMVLAHARIDHEIIHSMITQEMIRASECAEPEAEGIIDDLALCGNAEIAAIFWELADGSTRVQLRSIRAGHVLGIARAIGGGGHHRAAGGRMPGVAVDEARRRVFAAAGASSSSAGS
ncbi:MAG: DHH family phosphoesterase [Candidatus Hydrogenedentota bacterium]